MMSIERLYSRECPKSLSAEPMSHGLNPMTPADILNILAQVQKHEPIGNYVLQAKIQLDTTSRNKLKATLSAYIGSSHELALSLASSLAEHAVREVCDTCICPKCKGNGTVLYKKESKLIECRNCLGAGRIFLTSKKLFQSINKQIVNKITYEQFNLLYYDIYMTAVDKLNVEESGARRFAHEVMDRLEKDMAA